MKGEQERLLPQCEWCGARFETFRQMELHELEPGSICYGRYCLWVRTREHTGVEPFRSRNNLAELEAGRITREQYERFTAEPSRPSGEELRELARAVHRRLYGGDPE